MKREFTEQECQQLINEELFDKNQLIPSLIRYFGEYFGGLIQDEECLHILALMSMYKRMQKGTLAAMFYRGDFENCKRILQKADMLVEAGMLDIHQTYSGEIIYMVKILVDEESKIRIDNLAYPLPMVCEPRRVTEFSDGSILGFKRGITCRKKSKGDHNPQTVDRAVRVPLSINKRVHDSMHHCKKGTLEPLELLDKEIKEVEDYLINSGNRFYLLKELDRRGRIYDKGYQVKEQGSDYQKGVLELADKELINR